MVRIAKFHHGYYGNRQASVFRIGATKAAFLKSFTHYFSKSPTKDFRSRYLYNSSYICSGQLVYRGPDVSYTYVHKMYHVLFRTQENISYATIVEAAL